MNPFSFMMRLGYLSRQVICVVRQHEVICYTPRAYQAFSIILGEEEQLIEHLLTLLQTWKVCYVVLVIDLPEENLGYEQTPALHLWEIEKYAKRQLSKRFSNMQDMSGYSYIPMQQGLTLRPQCYLLTLFSQSQFPFLERLISRVQESSQFSLISIVSLSLLLGRYFIHQATKIYHEEKKPKQHHQKEGQVWLCAWQDNQISQLLCYRHLVLIRRDIHLAKSRLDLVDVFASSSLVESEEIQEENKLLLKFLQSQADTVLMSKLKSAHFHSMVSLWSEDQVFSLELWTWLWFLPKEKSHYAFVSLSAWQGINRAVKSLVLLSIFVFSMTLVVGSVVQWHLLVLEEQRQAIEVQHRLEVERLEVSTDQSEDMTLMFEALTESRLNSQLTPEDLLARRRWMQEWHRLKMALDPTPSLTAISLVLGRFQAIELFSLSYHNGDLTSAEKARLDIRQVRLQLSMRIDAKEFASLPEENLYIRDFLQALAQISGVVKVELLANPVITLLDQPMTTLFAPSSETPVLHPLVILLHLQPLQ